MLLVTCPHYRAQHQQRQESRAHSDSCCVLPLNHTICNENYPRSRYSSYDAFLPLVLWAEMSEAHQQGFVEHIFLSLMISQQP